MHLGWKYIASCGSLYFSGGLCPKYTLTENLNFFELHCISIVTLIYWLKIVRLPKIFLYQFRPLFKIEYFPNCTFRIIIKFLTHVDISKIYMQMKQCKINWLLSLSITNFWKFSKQIIFKLFCYKPIQCGNSRTIYVIQ